MCPPESGSPRSSTAVTTLFWQNSTSRVGDWSSGLGHQKLERSEKWMTASLTGRGPSWVLAFRRCWSVEMVEDFVRRGFSGEGVRVGG